MLFNSLTFVLLFLPVSLLAFYGAARLGRRPAAGVLVFFSLVFYGWWNPAFLLLLLGSIGFNYIASLCLLAAQAQERRQKLILAASIAANILLLVYYKYLFPLMNWLDTLGLHVPRDTDSVILPLGISFFTFTQIGYLVDCQAGLVKEARKLLDYMLFVTFFPHLIAGPILHHREMMPQFADPATYRFRPENMAPGLVIFIMGLAKKVLVADHFAPIVKTVFDHPTGLAPMTAWGGALSYTIQLYFDFSGYSEMALGLALMFGVRFPANFNSPFKATNVIDYWQRFHMTLTRYLTLYLYNPIALMISRRRMARGKPVSKKATATFVGFASMIAFPTVFTMGLAGVWHGAGLQFLIFGLLHGFYITVNHAWRIWGPVQAKTPQPASYAYILTTPLKVLLTLLAVVLAQVFFRSSSVANAIALLQSMVGIKTEAPVNPPALSYDFIETLLAYNGYNPGHWLEKIQFGAPLTLGAAFLWVWFMPNVLQVMQAYQPSLTVVHPSWLRWRPNVGWGIVLGLLAALTMLAITGTTEFLYFQF